MSAPAAQLAADFSAVYAKRHPERPAPLVLVYGGNRFAVTEGWATSTLNRAALLRRTASMFIEAATGSRQ